MTTTPISGEVGYLHASHGFLRGYCRLCRPGDPRQIAGTASPDGDLRDEMREHYRTAHGLDVVFTLGSIRDSAAALGSLGGSRHTEAQQAAARKPKAGAGRPRKQHVPSPGHGAGLAGPSLCHRHADYRTGDWDMLYRAAREAVRTGKTEGWCVACLRRLRARMAREDAQRAKQG